MLAEALFSPPRPDLALSLRSLSSLRHARATLSFLRVLLYLWRAGHLEKGCLVRAGVPIAAQARDIVHETRIDGAVGQNGLRDVEIDHLADDVVRRQRPGAVRYDLIQLAFDTERTFLYAAWF